MCLCYDVMTGVLSCSIETCREGVVNKRQKVKKASGERSRKLQASLAWQQFSRDSDEVRDSTGNIISQYRIAAFILCTVRM